MFEIFEEKLLVFRTANTNFENCDLVHAKTRHVLTYYQNFKSFGSVVYEIAVISSKKCFEKNMFKDSNTILQYIAVYCTCYSMQAINHTYN